MPRLTPSQQAVILHYAGPPFNLGYRAIHAKMSQQYPKMTQKSIQRAITRWRQRGHINYDKRSGREPTIRTPENSQRVARECIEKGLTPRAYAKMAEQRGEKICHSTVRKILNEHMKNEASTTKRKMAKAESEEEQHSSAEITSTQEVISIVDPKYEVKSLFVKKRSHAKMLELKKVLRSLETVEIGWDKMDRYLVQEAIMYLKQLLNKNSATVHCDNVDIIDDDYKVQHQVVQPVSTVIINDEPQYITISPTTTAHDTNTVIYHNFI